MAATEHWMLYLGVYKALYPAQALLRPYPKSFIPRPGAFLRPVTFIILFFTLAKAIIIFLVLVAVANAAPRRLSHPLSIIFSCLHQLQLPTWRSATPVSISIQGVALPPQ